MSSRLDPRIDRYIEEAGAFARPILKHLRAAVHEACPDATETIKWNMPFFESGGSILAMMAAFKAHASFGFWHPKLRSAAKTKARNVEPAMGSLGRLRSLADLPSDAVLRKLIRDAAALNASTDPVRRRRGSASEPEVPAYLAAALRRNAAARKTFAGFSPSHRREYVTWLTDAKREETRQRRLATTLEWLAAGKARDWKYAAS